MGRLGSPSLGSNGLYESVWQVEFGVVLKTDIWFVVLVIGRSWPVRNGKRRTKHRDKYRIVGNSKTSRFLRGRLQLLRPIPSWSLGFRKGV